MNSDSVYCKLNTNDSDNMTVWGPVFRYMAVRGFAVRFPSALYVVAAYCFSLECYQQRTNKIR